MRKTLIKETLLANLFGLKNIPLILFVSPRIEAMNEEECVIRIPLSWRTKNHLGSMYFGVLSTGADLAGGLIAMKLIHESGEKIALVFKEFHADFLKRAEGDVVFSCTQGKEIRDLVVKARETGERVNLPLHITATVPSKLGDEPVAKFMLMLSLKKKK